MEGKTRIVVIALVIIAVFLAIVFLIRGIASIANRTSSKPKTSTTASGSAIITPIYVNPSNINKDPLVYDGLNVVVDARISDWITKKIFALSAGSNSFFGGTSGQLVVISDEAFPLHKNSSEQGLGLGETVNVRVKGRVRIVNKAEFERITGISLDGEDIKLDDNSVSRWKEGPVILLDSVEKL